MEENRTFINGLHDDFDLQNQGEHTYRDALNITRELDGSFRPEKGTINVSVPEKNLIGSCSIDNNTVLFFHSSTGAHEIGYLDSNNTYNSVLTSPELNFKFGSETVSGKEIHYQKVIAKGEKNYKGEMIVYFVDGVNPDRVLNLSNVPSVDIGNQLKLEVFSKIPEIKLASVTDNGSVPTGIYQFQVRLLTGSTNKTIPSLMTNPIPIIDETGNSKVSDGALPQTPSFKSINLQLTNLDTNFKTYEVVMTTYEGLANVPRTYIVGRKPITSSTSNFTFSGMQHILEEITVDEVTVDPVVYSSSKHIAYNEGYLIRSNLVGNKEGNYFQKVANKTTIEYVVKEVDFNESFWIGADGQDGGSNGAGEIEDYGTSTHTEGYHNEEFCVDYKSWMRGEVYDIALVPVYTNNSIGSAYHIPAQAVATEANTTTKRLGSYVSQEKYPTGFEYPTGNLRFHVMPTLEQEPIYQPGIIRVLGIKVNVDLSDLTTEERATIKSWIVVRQRRKKGNKRVLCQGIAQPMVGIGKNNDLLGVSPFTGKVNNGHRNSMFYKHNHVAFYSPDIFIGGENPIPDKIERVAWVSGTAHLCGLQEKEGVHFKDKFVNIFIDYKSYHTTGFSKGSSIVNKNTAQNIPAETSTKKYNAKNIDKVVSTYNNNGFYLFKTNDNVEFKIQEGVADYPNGADMYYDDKSGDDDMIFVTSGGIYHSHDDKAYGSAKATGHSKRVIYNLIDTSDRLYGDISTAEYVYVGQGDVLYNGDTFINKVAIMSCTSDLTNDNEEPYVPMKTLSYVFLESSINTSFRHYTNAVGNEKGTVPYYPKLKKLFSGDGQDGLFQVKPHLGHSNGYNQQYSFDNGLKKFYPKPLLLDGEVVDFSNRLIYSERGIEGEQFNAKRVFLPNNYHDVPRDKGEIVETFNHNGSFYIKTQRSLFMASFNDRTAIASNNGDVILGNGGLFPVPSKEMYTVDGGYAGGYSLSCSTPFGRIWVGENQGKLLMLGESIEEVSLAGKRKFFLGATRRPETALDSYSSVYDYVHRRYILSCKDWTISYMPELKSFSSYHSYLPKHMFSNGNKVFIFGNGLGLLNEGPNATYFNSVSNASIHIPFNQNPLVTKVFDNLFIQASNQISFINVYNNEYTTGSKLVVLDNDYKEYNEGECILKFKNSQYQLAIPRANEQRVKGKWCIVAFSISGDSHVKYVSMLYRNSAR
jgi:hypothetical protein